MLAVLLTGTVWLSRCASCRTLESQEPVHDCCQKDSCHRDSGQEPAGQPCPHQAPALENYAQADPVTAVVAVAAVVLDAGSDFAPLPAVRVTPAAPLLVHSPPDLFLRNSSLLI